MAQPTSVWRRLRLVLAAAGLLLLAAPAGAGQCSTQVVCRKEMISGCEAEYAEAVRHLGHATTGDPGLASVYVTLAGIDPEAGSTGRTLYLQSNFITPGFENPTKIAVPVSTAPDLRTLLANALHSHFERGDPLVLASVAAALESATLIVDRSVFSSPLAERLELWQAKNLFITSARGPRRALRRIDHSRQLVENVSAFLYKRPTARDPDLASLRAIPVGPGRVKLVPLLLDSAAERRVAALPGDNVVDFDPAAGDLEAAIRQHAGGVLVLLGHVDEQAGEYQVRSRSGKLLRQFALADVERWAQAYQTVVIPLGCHSAMFASTGAAVRFNALYALDRFAGALKAETLLDFLVALGGEKLLLVVDEGALGRAAPPDAVSVVKIDAFAPDSVEPAGTIRAYLPFAAWPSPTRGAAANPGPGGDSRSADDGTVLLLIGLGILVSGGAVASIAISRSRA